MGILRRKVLKFLHLIFRNHASLILEYKVMASDNDFMIIDGSGDSVSYNIVDFGMHLLVIQLAVFCS